MGWRRPEPGVRGSLSFFFAMVDICHVFCLRVLFLGCAFLILRSYSYHLVNLSFMVCVLSRQLCSYLIGDFTLYTKNVETRIWGLSYEGPRIAY